MGDLTQDFSKWEFECPCCGESKMNPKFMKKLQNFRIIMGFPISPVPGGGYRCPDYNKSETGAHVEGRAIDPDIPREHYHKALNAAMAVGMTGIGVKNKSGKFQLHLDDADAIPGKRPRPWVWTY